MKEEASLSVAEIIRKRFKDKVKINTAKTAEEVQNLIIKPAESANSDFDQAWYIGLINEARHPKINGTLGRISKSITDRVPTIDALSEVSSLVAQSLH